ncbi:Cysteine-rich receptor-like protein kinase 19 [Vitis vinifera]|uniref:Cysteine-rich receptor-like protein kinase 19 n=1 Tax=Vitis vinifera TaxID=29760 RepID=A0A438IVY7_VITVI|nr:Cysteine-rich receptor-like protein kinase 19 [Vitis vinifera]
MGRFCNILFFLCAVTIHLSIGTAQVRFTFKKHACVASGNYSANSTYSTSLNIVLSSLSANASRPDRFYNTTAGLSPDDKVYGIFLCRGDTKPQLCQDCVKAASEDLVNRCPNQKEAIIWFDVCMVRYANRAIFSYMEQRPRGSAQSPTAIRSDSGEFNRILGDLMDRLVTRAVSGSPQDMFAIEEVKVTDFRNLYGLVQCTPDISQHFCNVCLRNALGDIPTCCGWREGGRVLAPSCTIRYESGPFFETNGTTVPSSPPATSSSQPPTNPTIAPVATNNFSNGNTLGRGGFGDVYKGVLSNGQEIAVKRLSKKTDQGEPEFKNEVLLLAKLQHRNLIRLLGFCLDGEERLLIYEFLPNSSLDHFIFDPANRVCLDWERRHRIIKGIARGLLYLHEDSRLRIVHCDLKASNILLDEDMNPKISDFGMARLFSMDETHANASRIAGTYGYMAPEYAHQGHFSTKSDVYSFGVLILEIVSGQKICFDNGEELEHLVTYAWRHWNEGRVVDIVDPILGTNLRNEIIRCLHIGLLCVQESVANRPTMALIVSMLNSYYLPLPSPSRPGFLMQSSTQIAGHSSQMRISTHFTVNEVSITDLYPR